MDKETIYELAWAVAFVLCLFMILSERVEGAEKVPPPDRVARGVDKTGTKAYVCSYWDNHPAVKEFCVTFVRGTR